MTKQPSPKADWLRFQREALAFGKKGRKGTLLDDIVAAVRKMDSPKRKPKKKPKKPLRA